MAEQAGRNYIMAPLEKSSGIRNAEVRYNNRVDNLSTEAHIRARTNQQGEGGATAPQTEGGDTPPTPTSRGRNAQLNEARVRLAIERAAQELGIEYTPEEISEIAKTETKKPEAPSFPFFMLSLALIKDILDYFTLTGVGYVVSLVASFIIGLIIFIWVYRKGGGGPLKQRQTKRAIRRFILANVADVIPGVNLIPFEAVFVFMTYSSEKADAENMGRVLGKVQKFKKIARR